MQNSKLKIYDEYVIRKVDDIEQFDKIVDIINAHKDTLPNIIETEVFEEAFLKHRKIKYIIHSGEYTESMSYDVNKIALDMIIQLIDYGIYTFDALPHNFTFENGEWILYDFDAFSLYTKQVKTQIRNMFKISFAAFELLKHIERSKLKYYFLNRIKSGYLFSMIPFFSWLLWMMRLKITQTFVALKMYKKSYLYLKKIFDKYNKKHIPKVYNYQPTKYEKQIFDKINRYTEFLKNVFCLGKFGGDWALASNNTEKIIYIDEYDLCDEFYNYIVKNNVKNITLGVLQALTNDKNIDNSVRYRALYDDFNKIRFLSDGVLLDFEEVFDRNFINIEEFCKNISQYAVKKLIIRIKGSCVINEKIKQELPKYFRNIEMNKFDEYYLIVCSDKVDISKNIKQIEYKNSNRMPDADEHSREILKIIKKNITIRQ